MLQTPRTICKLRPNAVLFPGPCWSLCKEHFRCEHSRRRTPREASTWFCQVALEERAWVQASPIFPSMLCHGSGCALEFLREGCFIKSLSSHLFGAVHKGLIKRFLLFETNCRREAIGGIRRCFSFFFKFRNILRIASEATP